MLEVITPAPNAESVIAAVQSGADAIIIRFGGAAGSGFTQAEFTKSVRYCRVRGCRVYAELDTLVADSELPAAAELARSACEAGVDAVIAQDWGFIPAARQAAPELRVFAGERLGLHNAAGIEAALQLGASRVLLPCELSAEEIAALARRGRAELGVTAYGTLCASRQGQCYMAAINGRGSANRGSCPGLCREKYSLGGRMDDYPLSLRDLMALDRIPEFSALGIASVVVGRGLTRPEQLAKLTSVAAKCAKDGRKPTPLETDELELVLTGRQFTPGYYPGGPSEDMQGLPGQPDRDAERAMHALRKGYADSELRRVKVEFFALIQAGRPFRSGIQDEDGNRAVWNGPEPMEAFGREFTQGTVEAEFRRTSGTPYSCERVNVMLGPGLMLPEGTLQQARRELIRALTVKRAEPPQVETGRLIPVPGGSPEVASLDTIFEVMSAAQLTEELAELEPDFLYVPLDVLAEDPGSIEPFLRRGATVAAVMPRVIHDGELRGVAALLQKARTAGVTQALGRQSGPRGDSPRRGPGPARGLVAEPLQLLLAPDRREGRAAFRRGLFRAEHGADKAVIQAAGYGDNSLWPPARHADGALPHKGQRGPLRLRRPRPYERRIRRGIPRPARVRLPQRCVRPGKGLSGRQAGRRQKSRSARGAAALHERRAAGVRGGRKELFGPERIPAERAYARALLQRC